MLRKFTLFFFVILSYGSIFAQSTGTLQGVVKDPTTGESIPFASISIQKGNTPLTGGMTDFDGKYSIKPIPAGRYTIKVTSIGYNPQQVNDVEINGGKITFLDFKLSSSSIQLTDIVVTTYKRPLISKDQTQSGGTVGSEAIAKMPGRSAEAVATTVGGVYSENGGVGSIRGARSEGNTTYIDGIKVRGSSSVPKSAVEEVSVITGGMPAEYGDATGGVISIITKGPSDVYYGGIEMETSRFLDPYDHNLLALNISGPLLTIKDRLDSTKRNTVLGFLIAGEFKYDKDNYPSAIGYMQANDDVYDFITKNPFVFNPTSNQVVPSTDLLQKSDFKNIKAANNAAAKSMNLSGKIEFQPSMNLNFTLGASLDYSNQHSFILSNSLFNSENNPQSISTDWRVFGRMTQKFTNSNTKEEQAKASVIKNAFYSLQLDYSRSSGVTQDDTHKDNLFNYGYVGKFKTDKVANYVYETEKNTGLEAYVYKGMMDTMIHYTPSDINPDMAIYNTIYFDKYEAEGHYRNFEDFNGEAFKNGESPSQVYQLWTLPGVQYDNYSKYQADQFRMTAKGSADIKNHEISVGFEFEQRQDRGYSIAPTGLWSLARKNMNYHNDQLQDSIALPKYDQYGAFTDTINYNLKFNKEMQKLFDINMRKHLGLDLTGMSQVEIDEYDPSDLSIDYFAADELINQGVGLSYYGYDHTGKKVNGNPSLQDFFDETQKYAVGDTVLAFKTRRIPVFSPIYMAGYIQDKFAFKDLIFRIGVRVDRYDANQKVLKDPYSLSEIRTAGESLGIIGYDENHVSKKPSNIGDDFAVYVDDQYNPQEVLGYRNGSTWYNKDGEEINDPDLIQGPSGITPYLNAEDALIFKEGYDSEKTFEDYKPEINVNPRIGFSFPISDVALFTAHYDVLTKRPTYGSRLDPVEYLLIESYNSSTLNNPNARSEKTIDYELGFQQKLGNTSSLKLSAFYREMRNMQQTVTVYGAFPVNYMTYGNVDYGTVKGFTAAYDLRRTGNITLTASYTLQFANGTGSNAATGYAFARENLPNLRVTLPLEYDQRHAIVGNLDYRFGEGKDYTGPKWFGMDILQNTGANFIVNVGSGSPYSRLRSAIATQFNGGLGSTEGGDDGEKQLKGTINGSRKPWRTTINARFDKDVVFSIGGSDSGKEVYLNIYLDISNILNTKNILNVYRATGNPEDDGYLASKKGQDNINTSNNPDSYINYYKMALNSPYNYSLPRTIIFGASLSF